MKILISSIIDLSKTSYSRLHFLIEHFLRSGHDVTVISIKDNWKHKGLEQNKDLMKNIDVRYITKKSHGAIRQKLSVPFKLGRLLDESDLKTYDIHLSYSSLLLGYFIAKKVKKYGIRTVYDLADDLPEMISTSPHIPAFMRPFGGAVGKVLLRKNLKLADFITITAKEFRKSMGISRYDHEVVPNGVDIKKFRPKVLKHKGFIIGYLGALREWVDLRPMLLAVKKLAIPDIKVLVVGGEEDLLKYKRFVEKYGMKSIVRFTGNVPYDHVPRYINMMDVATIPFRKNKVTDGTCPLKLLEYMAMKKPVICSDLNEIRSMVKDRVLYADNADTWADAISTLYDDKRLRKKMGKDGRDFIQKHYDWNSIGEKMEKILIRLSKNK